MLLKHLSHGSRYRVGEACFYLDTEVSLLERHLGEAVVPLSWVFLQAA